MVSNVLRHCRPFFFFWGLGVGLGQLESAAVALSLPWVIPNEAGV